MVMALQKHIVLLFLTCLFTSSYSYQFMIGGKDGWIPNPSENYNTWSQRMRFQINDSVLFKYKQGADSVLEVSKNDYDKCNTANPIKKMEDGNSVFTFDRSGPFYFISGNKDNCDKGQKLQIIVISVRKPPTTTPPAPQTPTPVAAPPSNGPSSPTTPSPSGGSTTPPPKSSTPPASSPGAAPPTGSSTPSASAPSGAPVSTTPAGTTFKYKLIGSTFNFLST
ncbi:hypothetical protein T459_23777 [Capsicum annuum]|uniref:Phytocyanin domain-containing protein n=1 Tax=Capsicum annuum TaxID=4072 RepID=A0A2G2YTC6_CAPAN|nr:hypothetical protein T459_23777 [Capsicum annuum]